MDSNKYDSVVLKVLLKKNEDCFETLVNNNKKLVRAFEQLKEQMTIEKQQLEQQLKSQEEYYINEIETHKLLIIELLQLQKQQKLQTNNDYYETKELFNAFFNRHAAYHDDDGDGDGDDESDVGTTTDVKKRKFEEYPSKPQPQLSTINIYKTESPNKTNPVSKNQSQTTTTTTTTTSTFRPTKMPIQCNHRCDSESYAFIPCGHQACCEDCFKKQAISHCPTCYHRVSGTFLAFDDDDDE
ncbi:hypothetical protein DFA_09849 [Cavenderia fasciculata]|uniref:RING-type domain-containing protein n=1 Tax=Cavenderia fasciculata TaxID=261658 RepID=F4QAW7_CACFS|nr:uncharacterized protein DFA_09849 [Cavenderia fasciculata]EGG15026.1 hypothetical protein DFA_09849 [Cavenderia fasciculata]|eukprot:XP_004351746.1 hypothetical protein DFA_09849 [Cavenderia fasciculata]